MRLWVLICLRLPTAAEWAGEPGFGVHSNRVCALWFTIQGLIVQGLGVSEGQVNPLHMTEIERERDLRVASNKLRFAPVDQAVQDLAALRPATVVREHTSKPSSGLQIVLPKPVTRASARPDLVQVKEPKPNAFFMDQENAMPKPKAPKKTSFASFSAYIAG